MDNFTFIDYNKHIHFYLIKINPWHTSQLIITLYPIDYYYIHSNLVNKRNFFYVYENNMKNETKEFVAFLIKMKFYENVIKNAYKME